MHRYYNFLAYLLAAIPFMVVPFFWYPFVTGQLVLWCSATLIALGILWYARHTYDLKAILQDSRILLFGIFALWLVLRGISTLPSAWWGSWIRSDGIFLLLSVLPIAAALLGAEKLAHKKIGAVFLVTCLVGVIVSQLFVLAPGAEAILTDSRWSGSVGNALFFGTLVLFFPFMGYLCVAKKNAFIRRIFLSIVLFIAAALVYKTGSRGAVLAVCGGIVAYGILWARERGTTWWKMCVAGVIGVVFFIAIATGIQGRAFDFALNSSTVQVRLQLYASAWQSFLEHPIIGYGPILFHDAIAQDVGNIDAIAHREQIFDSTHSFFIDLALAGGLVALFLYGTWFWYVYRTLHSLGRATFISYHIALLTAPFQMWTLPAVVLLIVCGQKNNFEIKKFNVLFLQLICVSAGAVIALSALLFLIVVPLEAWRMQKVFHTSASIADIADGAGRQVWLFPYLVERDALYAQHMAALLQAPLASTLQLSGLRPLFLLRVKQAIIENKAPVESVHTFSYFSQMYAPYALNETMAEWLTYAEKGYRAVLARAPGRPATVIALAGLLHEQGRDPEAGVVLQEFITRYPESPTANFYFAVHLETIGDHAGALRYAARAFELRPKATWRKEQQVWFDELQKK